MPRNRNWQHEREKKKTVLTEIQAGRVDSQRIFANVILGSDHFFFVLALIESVQKQATKCRMKNERRGLEMKWNRKENDAN